MLPRTPDFDMLPPWFLIERERASVLESELRKEIPFGHVLSQATFEAVAMSEMCDDVLFITDSRLGPLANVHLTWSGRRDKHHAFPSTEFYSSWEDFRNREMLPTHEDYE